MSNLQRLMTKKKSDVRKPILPMMVILTIVKVSLNGEGYLGKSIVVTWIQMAICKSGDV